MTSFATNPVKISELQLAQVCNALTFHVGGVDRWYCERQGGGGFEVKPPAPGHITEQCARLRRKGARADAALLWFAWELWCWPAYPDAAIDIQPLLDDKDTLARVAGLLATLALDDDNAQSVDGWLRRCHHTLSPSHPVSLERRAAEVPPTHDDLVKRFLG